MSSNSKRDTRSRPRLTDELTRDISADEFEKSGVMNTAGCHRGWMSPVLEAGRDRLEFGGGGGVREHSRMLKVFVLEKSCANARRKEKVVGRRETTGRRNEAGERERYGDGAGWTGRRRGWEGGRIRVLYGASRP